LKPQATLDDPNEWHIKSLPEVKEKLIAKEIYFINKSILCFLIIFILFLDN
jgi:hypothetical protein